MRGLRHRVDRILVLLLQLSKLLIKASLVVCIALCVSFVITFQAGEEEEEEEGRGHRNCNRHITSQSFRGRWTSTGGVRISSASRDTSSSQSALSPALSPLDSCCERPWRVRSSQWAEQVFASHICFSAPRKHLTALSFCGYDTEVWAGGRRGGGGC